MAVKEFGSLVLSGSVDVEMLSDTVEAGLEKMHLDSKGTREINSWVKNNKIEMVNYVKNHK